MLCGGCSRISPDRASLLANLERLNNQLQRQATRLLGNHQQRLDWLGSRLIHPAERLRQRRQEVAMLGSRLQRALYDKIDRSRLLTNTLQQRQSSARPHLERLADQLAHARYRLGKQLAWRISDKAGKLNALSCSLRQLDPHAVLHRGYTLAIGPDGRAVQKFRRLHRRAP